MSDARAAKKPTADVSAAEEEPAALAQNPDPESFEEVFRRYGKQVLGFVRSLMEDRSLAEELTQETFIRAYLALGSKRFDTKTSTWLFGIAHNVVREAVKQKYRNQPAVGLDDSESRNIADSRQRPDQCIISRDMFHKMQRAIANLSEDQRLVLVLKMVYRLQYEEISSITGASVGKLKTDMHRARLEMRRRLTPYFGEQVSGMRGKP